MHDVVPPELGVHSREDVLRQVEPLGRLGETALRHKSQLVHHIRMAVVVPCIHNGRREKEPGGVKGAGAVALVCTKGRGESYLCVRARGWCGGWAGGRGRLRRVCACGARMSGRG